MSKKVRRAERKKQKQRSRQMRKLVTTTIIILFIGVLAYFSWAQSGGSNALPAESVADPALGGEEAIVEIVEYGDFGCPACRAWHNSGIRERVLADFGDQVRFVWKDFPIITAQSSLAAQAGQCASRQNKFWEYHDYLYENVTSLSKANLVAAGTALDLDTEQLQSCIDQGLMVKKVQANEQEARRLGLRGTPGFAVNGRALSGPPNFEQLSQLVRAELN